MLAQQEKLGARQCWHLLTSLRLADGLVLLLAYVLNRIHVDSK
jgi:hypothetical protein